MLKMLGVLVFLTILCSIHGSLSENKRIHGGHPIHAPFVVHLGYVENRMYHECTASLIKPQYILTAAHCLNGTTNVTVTYGCSDLRNKRKCKEVAVEQYLIHPEYFSVENISSENDIAVGMLSRPIGVPTIGLPNRPVDSRQKAILMGWGSTETSGERASEILLSIILPIKGVTKDEIIVYHSQKRRIDGGDSGGPLVIGKTVFGVASHTRSDKSGQHIDGVYMNVYHYLGFIGESIWRLQ